MIPRHTSDAGVRVAVLDLESHGRYYRAQVGCHEFGFWSLSDSRAGRVVRKWLALFWRRYKLQLHDRHAGSVAHAVAFGLDGRPPRAELYRYDKGPRGVAGAGFVRLRAYSFEIDDEVIRLPGFGGR